MTNLIDVTADYLRVNDGVTFDTGSRYVETTTGTPDFVTIEGPSTAEAFPAGGATIVRWIWKIGTATYQSKDLAGGALAGIPATTFNTTTNIKLTD